MTFLFFLFNMPEWATLCSVPQENSLSHAEMEGLTSLK